jgi:FkbM family methyltransferase
MTFLSRVLRPGMVVVDAGANEGFYTIFMAKRVSADGLVVAVEPSPRERARLLHNLAINGLGNVRVVDKGLAAERGRAVLHIADSEHNGQNTLGTFIYPGVGKQSDLEIDLEPLDETIEAVARRPIDLIKMDVEGAELRVLQGARRILEEDAPLILFEVLDNALRAQGASAETLINFLRAKGYAILKFNGDGHLSELSNATQASSNLLAVPTARVSDILNTQIANDHTASNGVRSSN